MNIVFAVREGQSEEALEKQENGLREAAARAGVDIRNINRRSSKAALMRVFENIQDIDAIVCQEFLDEQLTAVDFESIIKKSKSGLIIIVIVDEERGSGYLERLLNQGIYNAVFTTDASFAAIAERLVNPYSRKDALQYYGIVRTVGAASSSEDMQQLIQYMSAYDGTVESLLQRTAQVSDRVASDEFLEILIRCPDDVLNKLKLTDRYKQIAELAESEKTKRQSFSFDERTGVQESSVIAEAELPDKKKKKKEKPKKEKIKKNAVRPIGSEMQKELAFTSTNKGVGCTYSSLLCAYSLNSAGYRAAVVELDNQDNNFTDLAKQVLRRSDVCEVKNFSFGGVDFYLNMPLYQFQADHKSKYDYIIYDFGCCSNDVIANAVMTCEKVFVIASPQEYKYGELMDFVSDVQNIDVRRAFIYLFPICDEEMLGNLSELIGTDRVDAVPMDRNPFHPANNTMNLFTAWVKENGPGKRKLEGATKLEDRLLKEDPQDKKPFTVVSFAALMAVTVILVMVSVVIKVKMTKVNEALAASLQSEQAYSHELEGKLSDAQNEISSYDRKVIVFKEPVNLGTLITEDMVEEKVIKSNEPSDVYVTKTEIAGKYTACNIEEGVPVYHYYVADMVEPFIIEPETSSHEPEALGETPAEGEDDQ